MGRRERKEGRGGGEKGGIYGGQGRNFGFASSSSTRSIKVRWLVARVFSDKSRGEIRDFKMQLFRARARHKRRHYTTAQRVPRWCVQHEGAHVRQVKPSTPRRSHNTLRRGFIVRRISLTSRAGFLINLTGCPAKWILGKFVRRLRDFRAKLSCKSWRTARRGRGTRIFEKT